jgi:uncharacterized membrane protein YuzA (DUF378 family)
MDMKALGILAAGLIVIGGLNWGLVGLVKFDLVKVVLGDMTMLSRVVYTLVGLSAIYWLFNLKALTNRS